MPAIGIHLLALDELAAQLSASQRVDDQQNGLILSRNPAFAALGAIGPDLAYFLGFAPRVVQALDTVYEFINTVSSLFDEVSELAAVRVGPNTRQRVEELGQIIQTLSQTFETTFTEALYTFISIGRGPLLPPPKIQEGRPELEWEWGDILHWRATGSIAAALLQESNEEYKAYGLGYISHIATDFLGHPYTNQVVGGPYRAWPTRHHLAENFMDVHAYMATKGLTFSHPRDQNRSCRSFPRCKNLNLWTQTPMRRHLQLSSLQSVHDFFQRSTTGATVALLE